MDNVGNSNGNKNILCISLAARYRNSIGIRLMFVGAAEKYVLEELICVLQIAIGLLGGHDTTKQRMEHLDTLQ